jgi:hypothetical protein
MQSCDKLGSIEEKCGDRACHRALHYLLEEDVLECYVSSNMGPASDLEKYRTLDNTCHSDPPSNTSLTPVGADTNSTQVPVPTSNAVANIYANIIMSSVVLSAITLFYM